MPQECHCPTMWFLGGVWHSRCSLRHSLVPVVIGSRCPHSGCLGWGLTPISLARGGLGWFRGACPPCRAAAAAHSPAPTHDGVVALGEAADEAIGVGKLGRSVHLGVRGSRLPEADVLHDGCAEEHWLLRQRPAPQQRAWTGPPPCPALGPARLPVQCLEVHPTAAPQRPCTHGSPHLADEADDLPSQPRGVQGGDVAAVQGDGALRGLIEPLQQRRHRRLPCRGEPSAPWHHQTPTPRPQHHGELLGGQEAQRPVPSPWHPLGSLGSGLGGRRMHSGTGGGRAVSPGQLGWLLPPPARTHRSGCPCPGAQGGLGVPRGQYLLRMVPRWPQSCRGAA